MSEFLILKKRKDFLRAAKDITMVSKNVMLQAARPVSADISPENSRKARIGFTATKRLGKAHIRNRTKRRLRAIVRQIYQKYALDNVDYVLIGRFDTWCCPFEDLKRDVIWTFRKTNKIILHEDENDEKTPHPDC
ncbi:MAG: ribonuclease P protein component [Pseudomonadota bacterium]|nr:ribonuclease P protein component [Pseudomonadota bacterium]